MPDPHDTAAHAYPEDWKHPVDEGYRDPYGTYQATDWEDRQSELAGQDEAKGYNWGPPPDEDLIPEELVREEEHRPGAILRQREQHPHHPLSTHYDDYDPNSSENNIEHQIELEHLGAYVIPDPQAEEEGNALDPERPERFWNRDPALGEAVHTQVGGDPPGVVSIEPPETAGPTDARVLYPDQTGLEYPVIARPSPEHPHSWDVLKPLVDYHRPGEYSGAEE